MERNLWKESEIRALLKIIAERNILKMINEKKFRNEQIFRFVESQLTSQGFRKKNFQQIWTKWKFLKSSYVTTRRHNSIPGNIPRTCDYYNLLDQILGDTSKNESHEGQQEYQQQQQEEQLQELQKENSYQPTICDVQGGVTFPGIVKQEIIDDEHESMSFENISEALDTSTPTISLPDLQKLSELHQEQQQQEQQKLQQQQKRRHQQQKRIPIKRKRLRITTEIPEASYTDIEHAEENPQKKPIQGNYLRALKELATNLRQMQKELITDFFRKQEELIREEHEFQRQQDEILLKSFEEQTRLLLDSARNLLASGVSGTPDVVYINED